MSITHYQKKKKKNSEEKENYKPDWQVIIEELCFCLSPSKKTY